MDFLDLMNCYRGISVLRTGKTVRSANGYRWLNNQGGTGPATKKPFEREFVDNLAKSRGLLKTRPTNPRKLWNNVKKTH